MKQKWSQQDWLSANVKLLFVFSMPTQTGAKADWAGVSEKRMCNSHLSDCHSYEHSMMTSSKICIFINF